MQAVAKTVVSALGPLTLAQRTQMQTLISLGIDPKVARAIALGYAVNKAANAAEYAVLKAEWDESLHPRDEAGRFGPAIGATASGKAVYRDAQASEPGYAGFGSADHAQAAKLHYGIARKTNDSEKQRKHERLARGHEQRQLDEEAREMRARAQAKQASRQAPALSKEQNEALVGYVTNGDTPAGYLRVNEALESAQHGPDDSDDTRQSLVHAAHLNQAIQNSPLRAAKTLHRGTEIDDDVQAGHVISTPRLVSTSSDEKIATRFAKEAAASDEGDGRRYAVMHIRAPRGTPVLDVNAATMDDSNSEREHIFGSGQRFAVRSIKQRKDGLHDVYMDALPQDHATVAKSARLAGKSRRSRRSRFSDDAGFSVSYPEASVNKTAVPASDVHVPVPLGKRRKKKKRADKALALAQVALKLASADFDEGRHPRATNGEWTDGDAGSGPSPTAPRELTPKEKDTVKAYTSSDEDEHPDLPSGFIQIHRALMGRSKLDAQGTAEALQHAKTINDAIAASSLEEDATLWRGTPFIPGLQVGHVIQTPAILSTSSDKQTAQDFALSAMKRTQGGPGSMIRMVMEIHAPKGTPVLDINERAATFDRTEYEHLFASGQRFAVQGIRVEGNTHTVALQALNGGAHR